MKLAWVCLLVTSVSLAAPKKHEPAAVVLCLDHGASTDGPRLDAEKAAALAVVDALAPDDQIAIVAYDNESSIVVPLQHPNRKRFTKAIAALQPGEGRNVYPPLKQAELQLKPSKLARKHVIFFTDGDADTSGIPELLGDMSSLHITVSAMGIQGAGRQMLQVISEHGNGRLYMIDEVSSLPKVFVKEIKDALGR